MTNKQAQITINSIKFMLDHAQYSDDVEEALNMAISALTAQSEERTKERTETHACDLISRQAAIDEWKNDFKGYINALNMPKDDYNGIMEYINELPSVQPERRKGHWIIDGHHIQCSVCAEAMCNTDREGDKIPRNFCPNCGSDMRGGERNDEPRSN